MSSPWAKKLPNVQGVQGGGGWAMLELTLDKPEYILQSIINCWKIVNCVCNIPHYCQLGASFCYCWFTNFVYMRKCLTAVPCTPSQRLSRHLVKTYNDPKTLCTAYTNRLSRRLVYKTYYRVYKKKGDLQKLAYIVIMWMPDHYAKPMDA
jgi:hypothetical protein